VQNYLRAILVATTLNVVVVSDAIAENLKLAPDFVFDFTVRFFMAEQVIKYCDEIVENPAAAKAALDAFKVQQANYGEGASMGSSVLNQQIFNDRIRAIMEENGGPFMFDPERHCEYGFDQIEAGTEIGKLLQERPPTFFERLFGK